MTFTGVQGVICQVTELPTATIVGVSNPTKLLKPFFKKIQFCAWGAGLILGLKFSCSLCINLTDKFLNIK
jgi:hypothetical protein